MTWNQIQVEGDSEDEAEGVADTKAEAEVAPSARILHLLCSQHRRDSARTTRQPWCLERTNPATTEVSLLEVRFPIASNKQRIQELAFEVHSTTALTSHQSTGHEAQAGKQENAAVPNSGGSDQQSEGSELVMVPLKSTAAQRAKALKNAQDRHTARQAIVNCARNLPAIFEEDNEDGGIEVNGGGNSIHESERGDVRPAQQNQDDALLSKASDSRKEEQEPSPSVARTAKWVHSGLQRTRASIEAEMSRIRATSTFIMEQEKKLDELTAQLEDLGTLVVETIE